MPTEGQNSTKLEAESALYGAACSPSLIRRRLCPACQSETGECQVVFMRWVGNVAGNFRHVETLCASVPLPDGITQQRDRLGKNTPSSRF